jgi:hypothetical protein
VSSGLEEAGERFKHRIEETVPLAYLEGIEGAGSISRWEQTPIDIP